MVFFGIFGESDHGRTHSGVRFEIEKRAELQRAAKDY